MPRSGQSTGAKRPLSERSERITNYSTNLEMISVLFRNDITLKIYARIGLYIEEYTGILYIYRVYIVGDTLDRIYLDNTNKMIVSSYSHPVSRVCP